MLVFARNELSGLVDEARGHRISVRYHQVCNSFNAHLAGCFHSSQTWTYSIVSDVFEHVDIIVRHTLFPLRFGCSQCNRCCSQVLLRQCTVFEIWGGAVRPGIRTTSEQNLTRMVFVSSPIFHPARFANNFPGVGGGKTLVINLPVDEILSSSGRQNTHLFVFGSDKLAGFAVSDLNNYHVSMDTDGCYGDDRCAKSLDAYQCSEECDSDPDCGGKDCFSSLCELIQCFFHVCFVWPREHLSLKGFVHCPTCTPTCFCKPKTCATFPYSARYFYHKKGSICLCKL